MDERGPIVLLVPTRLAAVSFVLLSSSTLLAQESSDASGSGGLSLRVERSDEAVSCPDEAWFREQIASHAGDAGQSGSFVLTLSRAADGWHAVIQRLDGEAAAERVLVDRSSACRPLAEATAVTLAILADSSTKPAAPPPTPAKPTPPPPPRIEALPPRPLKVWVGAGGGAAVSFISPVAPVLGFSVGVDSQHLRHTLRAMLTTEQKFTLDPGHVFVQAWLLTALSCVHTADARVGGALCAALDASMLRASADGFDAGRPSSRAYGAAGVELQLGYSPLERYRISAAAGALATFTRESFSVAGLGVAYVPPQINWRILVFSEIGAF